MTFEYLEVKNPKWANKEQTIIVCEVNFSHLPEEFVPFAANPDDGQWYSKEIFDRCLRGDFGQIQAFVEK